MWGGGGPNVGGCTWETIRLNASFLLGEARESGHEAQHGAVEGQRRLKITLKSVLNLLDFFFQTREMLHSK